MHIFQGYHSNQWTYGDKIWCVNSSCVVERTIPKSKSLSQIVSELWAKIDFLDCCSRFSRKIYLVLHFFEYRDANALNRKLMIFRTNAQSDLAIYAINSERHATKMDTVAQNSSFSRFLFFLNFKFQKTLLTIGP